MVDVLPGLAERNAERKIMNLSFTVYLGAILFSLAALHLYPSIALWDARLFLVLHPALRRWVQGFRILWQLGRTPFTILCLLGMTLFNVQNGIRAAIVFALIASLEWGIKRSLQRARPFSVLPNVEMEQPRPPHDASFPSGDAMRIWFLALALPAVLGLPLLMGAGACLLALIVSLGRVALGVHYPLDVLAGIGLGTLGAGVLQFII